MKERMAGGLDHLVIVAGNLEAEADLYRRLGFQVGARNRHDWGTLNHIVQFDGCFLELLTTEENFVRPSDDAPVAQFVGTIVDYLAERDGLAMMVLEGFDAAADHAAFQGAGIGTPETFYFARQGQRPDGASVEVAFSLAFAQSPLIRDAGFFVCQQHAPEMFWNPAFQAHPNGAINVAKVVFAAADPAAHAAFFAAYTDVGGSPVAGGHHYALARGGLDVITPAAVAERYGAAALPDLSTPRFAAIEFWVKDQATLVAALESGGIEFGEIAGAGPDAGSIVVPARVAMGVTLVFRSMS